MEVSKILCMSLKARSQRVRERGGSRLIWPTVRNNVAASNKVFRPVFWANCDDESAMSDNV